MGVTNSGCFGSLVFAHEIGHNFGAEHDRYVEPEADHDYNYGYVDLETASKTIMAYSNLCDDNGKSCEQLPYFSNPALEHQNRPLGIAAGEPEAADNQKMLNFSALTLANYAGAGAPAGLVATNNNNMLGVSLQWQPFAGATHYEVYSSDSCYYDTYKTLIAETTGTEYHDESGTLGRCYFVQAVNNELLSGANKSLLSLPESGFDRGPTLSKIAAQRVDSIDQTLAISFSSAAVIAPRIEIIQHDLPVEPQYALQDLGNGQYQLSLSNLSYNDGTAIVKVTTDRVFEVFSVTFSGNLNTPPEINAPQKVTFNQQSSTSFNVDILDSQINLANPIGLLVLSEDNQLLPKAAVDYAVNYTDDGAQLTIDINPQHKLFGTTALNIQIADGEHLVSQRIEVEIVRVLNQLPLVPASTTMYLDGNKPLQRLLPVYDADNDVMEFTLLTGPSNGQLSINNNAFTYRADSDFTDDDSFSYRVTESYSGESFDATIVIRSKPASYLIPKQKLVSNINSNHMLLDYQGQLWAWGSNIWNLHSHVSYQSQPTPSALYQPYWADVGVNDDRALLIHQDGSLWQLGFDSLSGSNQLNSPKRIGSTNDWLSVLDSGDGNVYCHLLVKSDRSLWAFGSCFELAAAGLIDDAQSALQQPIQISALYHWVSGSHSQAETVLIDSSGKVWSGASASFSRYAGRQSEITYLAPVTGITSTALAVKPVTFKTYAFTEQGLVAWGFLPENAPWQWQDMILQSTAIQLDSPTISQLNATYNYLLILDTDNALWTAGGNTNSDNPNGALGRGDFADRGLAKVNFADGWQQVFSAQESSFGLSKTGQLLVTGTYDLERGTRTYEPEEQISVFTPIAQFDLKQLGYTDTDADGILDYLETDADNDGLPDGWELMYGLDRQNAADAALDNDNDSLTNLQEYQLGTNPNEADTDGDGMPDSWEVQYNFNPLNAADAILDSDNDNLTNAQEYAKGTNPHNADTDGDGMSDGWEVQYGLNPLNAADASSDLDNDGLTNLQEYQLGTHPNNADTDGDGMPDGWEIQYGLNPLDPADATSDKDNDDIIALQEYKNGTNPNVSNKVTPPPPPPPAETSSSGGSMPATGLVLLFAIAMYRRRYLS
uniref:Uncharacterized protein n=1 Tax=Rheinheimera sp. BAL341 TaxID=1708203 RepID=A0A486XT72_9GAMM